MSLLIGWVICPDKYYMEFHLVNKIIWINLGLKRYSSSSLFVVFGRNLPRKRPFWLPSGFAEPGTFLCRLRGMWMKMVPGSRNVKRCFKKKTIKSTFVSLLADRQENCRDLFWSCGASWRRPTFGSSCSFKFH